VREGIDYCWYPWYCIIAGYNIPLPSFSFWSVHHKGLVSAASDSGSNLLFRDLLEGLCCFFRCFFSSGLGLLCLLKRCINGGFCRGRLVGYRRSGLLLEI